MICHREGKMNVFVKGNGGFDVPDRLTGMQAVEVRQNHFLEKLNLFHRSSINFFLAEGLSSRV